MLVFPQFGLAAGLAGLMGVGTSQVPADGFLNNLHWTLAHTAVSDPEEAQDPAPSASFLVTDDPSTRAVWPHCFEAMCTVRCGMAHRAVQPLVALCEELRY